MIVINDTITQLNSNEYFVFGSNTQGRHGKGSALSARQNFGAIYGQSRGLQGQSYAICTKDISSYPHKSIDKMDITQQIADLYTFAFDNPNLIFYVVYKGYGTNLNGYTPQEMAEMFGGYFNVPNNIVFHPSFKQLM